MTLKCQVRLSFFSFLFFRMSHATNLTVPSANSSSVHPSVIHDATPSTEGQFSLWASFFYPRQKMFKFTDISIISSPVLIHQRDKRNDILHLECTEDKRETRFWSECAQ